MHIEVIERLLAREGGFVNHPDDRGGPTNMGITLETLSEWRGKTATAKDIERLTREEAAEIYTKLYWEYPGFAKLAPLKPVVQEFIFDSAVMHGTGAATKFLQKAVGTKADGVIGPATIAAAAQLPAVDLLAKMACERIVFLGRLVEKSPNQSAFIEGWLTRVCEFVLQLGPLARNQ